MNRSRSHEQLAQAMARLRTPGTHFHVQFTSTGGGQGPATVARGPRHDDAGEALDYVSAQPDMGPGRVLGVVPCTAQCPKVQR